VGWGKVAHNSSNISVTRRKIEEKLLWKIGGHIGTHQRSFEWYDPRPSTASSSHDWGFATPTQNCNRYYLNLSQEQVKLRTSKIWLEHLHDPSEQKPIKNFGEKEAWACPGTAQIFWLPPIISGPDKATNFKFCRHIHRINRNKSPLKILGNVAVGIVRDSGKFSRHSYRAHREWGRIQDLGLEGAKSSAQGARIEAPRVYGGGAWGRGVPALPQNFFHFWVSKCVFSCVLWPI